MPEKVSQRFKNIFEMEFKAYKKAVKEGQNTVVIPCKFCGGEAVYQRFEGSGSAFNCKNGCFKGLA